MKNREFGPFVSIMNNKKKGGKMKSKSLVPLQTSRTTTKKYIKLKILVPCEQHNYDAL